jgi:plasmid stabilization system protein ParE
VKQCRDEQREKDRDLLFFLVHSYLIVYRRDKLPLNVVRVLHSARDVKRLLAE